MPNDYLTTDTELTSVANAIRTKGGTSSSLVYPTGFVSAIEAISTGTDVSDTTAAASDVRTGKYFYTSAGVKTQGSLANGSATTPATTITANPSISVSNSGLITASNSKTQSVTPTVSAGYVSSGTAGTITVNGSNTSQLTTQAAQTIYPSTSDQTIASGKYLTGTQTIKGVLTSNITAENIKSGVTIKVGDTANNGRIKNVTGTFAGGASTSVFHFYGSSTSDESLSQYGLTTSDFESYDNDVLFSAEFTIIDRWGMGYGLYNCGYSYGIHENPDTYTYENLYIIHGYGDLGGYYGNNEPCDLFIKLSSITSSGITIDLQNSKITEANGTVNTLSSLDDFYLEIRVAK